MSNVVWYIDCCALLLQDSRLSLQSFLSSPHLTELVSAARSLDSALSEVEELLDLWLTCQNQAQLICPQLLSFR